MAQCCRCRLSLALSCSIAIGMATACDVTDVEQLQPGRPSTATRSIFYGQTAPTLYTGLTSSQQNAVVQLYASSYGGGFCSGSLVSEHVVLTAGHCIHPPGEAEFRPSINASRPDHNLYSSPASRTDVKGWI